MACQVFGNPVTDDTARKFYPNASEITAKHRAKAAVLCLNAEENMKAMNNFVNTLKAGGGSSGTSTHSTVFNTTGNSVTLIKKYICEGQMAQPPKTIQNGQSAAFEHTNTKGGCVAAIVYREDYDWIFAWNTTTGNSPNYVYTEIGEQGDFDAIDSKYIRDKLKNQLSSDDHTWNGRYASITLEAGSSPKLVAKMTLADT